MMRWKFHSPAIRKSKNAICNYCQKLGHLNLVCRKKAHYHKGKTQIAIRSNKTQKAQERNNSDVDVLSSTLPHPDPSVSLQPNGQTTTMELNTGATLSIMSEHTRNFGQVSSTVHKSSPQLQGWLHTHTGEKIWVVGQITVCVSYMQ